MDGRQAGKDCVGGAVVVIRDCGLDGRVSHPERVAQTKSGSPSDKRLLENRDSVHTHSNRACHLGQRVCHWWLDHQCELAGFAARPQTKRRGTRQCPQWFVDDPANSVVSKITKIVREFARVGKPPVAHSRLNVTRLANMYSPVMHGATGSAAAVRGLASAKAAKVVRESGNHTRSKIPSP